MSCLCATPLRARIRWTRVENTCRLLTWLGVTLRKKVEQMTTKKHATALSADAKVAPRPSNRILRWPDLQQRTGLSRATVYRKIKAKTFPAPIRLTDYAVGWREVDVEAWQASLTSVGGR